jgi:hypothetical protein
MKEAARLKTSRKTPQEGSTKSQEEKGERRKGERGKRTLLSSRSEKASHKRQPFYEGPGKT